MHQRKLAIATMTVLGVALTGCGSQDEPAAAPSSSAPVQAPPATTAPTPAPAPSATEAAGGGGSGVLSGTRLVTIVRSQAGEGGVSMDGGVLTERDDDSGRQRFVPTPAGKDTYLIKAYEQPTDDPASLEPSCWQVLNPQNSEPLSVQAAACDPADPAQLFTITPEGDAYAISNAGAFLRSSRSGLILEELGDAPLTDTFRFNDIGEAPAA